MKLFNHQKEALKIAAKNKSVALFHDPGLGKTRTSLEIYKQLRSILPDLHLLVICPLSLINSAWGEDIQKFTDYSFINLKILSDICMDPEFVYCEKTKKYLPDVVAINYESAIQDKFIKKIKSLIDKFPFMCVLDESSRLKNSTSLTTTTLLKLAPYFKYRIVASGTPCPNSELELWGQVNFLSPDFFPRFYTFRNTYFVMNRGHQEINLRGKFIQPQIMQDLFRKGWKLSITENSREQLLNKIKPFTHWVKKEDALDLPDKIDEIREVHLSSREERVYRDMQRDLIAEIDGTEITAPVVLTKIMKLRQITSGFIYDGTGRDHTIDKVPSKIKELNYLLEEIGSRQVIIWCQFHYEIDYLKKILKSTADLYAKTKDREKSIKDFQEGRAQYLIAHPRSAAHGLTFINCDMMIFYSMDYSYEAHEQARNRIHRIGQKNKCLYYYLTAKGTIDESLIRVVGKKAKLQDVIYEICGNKIKKQMYEMDKSELSGLLAV